MTTEEIPQQKRGFHPLVFLLILVVVIGGGLYWLYKTGPVIENQQGRIVGSGGPNVLAAVDVETFDQIPSVGIAKLAEWEQAERVALLPVGTQVLVLSVDVPRSKVRVTSGEFAGKEFYVLTTDVGH